MGCQYGQSRLLPKDSVWRIRAYLNLSRRCTRSTLSLFSNYSRPQILVAMYVKAIVLGAIVCSAAPIHQFKVPTVSEAAVEARTLVNRESLANLATIDQESHLPVSFMEYYADCDNDGTLTLLSLSIGSSFRNVAAGSPASLSIRVGDHAVNDDVNPHYPGGIVNSPAGSPRISLQGKFQDVDVTEHARLTQCFLKRHPDAKWWLPGNPVHTSKWTQFKVDEVYFLGGFGDRAYIGKIPIELYQESLPQESLFASKTDSLANDGEERNTSAEENVSVSGVFGMVDSLRAQVMSFLGFGETQLNDSGNNFHSQLRLGAVNPSGFHHPKKGYLSPAEFKLIHGMSAAELAKSNEQ